MEANNVALFHQIYPEVRWWCSVGGVFFVLYKAVDWIKSIKTNDLANVQVGVVDIKDSLDKVHDEVKGQTTAVCTELKEMRQEFRTYFAPMIATSARSRKRKK